MPDDKHQAIETPERIAEISSIRQLKGILLYAALAIAVAWSVFQFYTSGFGLFSALPQRATTLGFTLVLVFIFYPAFRKEKRLSIIWTRDVLLVAASIVVTGYIILNYHEIAIRAGMPTKTDIVLGCVAVCLVIEATRRTVGLPLVIVAAAFILYAMFGPYMPDMISHRGYSIERLSEQMFLTTDGIFGVPTAVMTTYVYSFLLFGSFLEISGGSKLFVNLAYSLTGARLGGPAKTAVISSGMLGTISGSSLANAVTTGNFTIPLMKSSGYKPSFAAGVEAAASSGGQIMPPVMGAAAFIMVEMTGLPYVSVIIAAAFPALLKFFSIYVMVHQEAARLGIKPQPRENLPEIKKALWEATPLIVPVAGIVGFLLYGMSPLKAAFYATILLLLSSSIRKETRVTPKRFLDGLILSAKNAMPVSAAVIMCGVIGGVVTMTGMGMKLAQVILEISQGMLLPTLLLTMVSCLIIGMGLPTTATYIVLAPIATPAMLQLGVPVMTAHLFIFYYGVLTEVTPPVALTSYATAAIAGSPGVETAISGFRTSFAGFLIPIMFVYSPELLLNGELLGLIMPMITAIIGMIALGSSLTGYFVANTSLVERVLLFVCAILFIHAELMTDFIGIALFGTIALRQWQAKKRVSENAVNYKLSPKTEYGSRSRKK